MAGDRETFAQRVYWTHIGHTRLPAWQMDRIEKRMSPRRPRFRSREWENRPNPLWRFREMLSRSSHGRIRP